MRYKLPSFATQASLSSGPISANASGEFSPATAADAAELIAMGATAANVGAAVVLPYAPANTLFDIFDQQQIIPRRPLSLPNPYYAIGSDMVHPGPIYFPEGWNGYRYWMAYTPYPGSNSSYENPCLACSNDGDAWITPPGTINPLVQKPSSGYNADTHLVASPDGKKLYLIYRERLITGITGNNVRVMESADGAIWSPPMTIVNGAFSTQDYACPSIFWDAINSRWIMLSHNLDGGSTYPMQRNISAGADIYSGWSGPTAITITHPTGGRTWWHSFFNILPDGRIIGLIQDTANGGGGGGGALFAAESWDSGLNFSVKQVYSDLNYYRPAFLIQGVHPPGMAAFVGKLFNGFSIHREDWQAGATQRAIDTVAIEYAAYGTIRSDVLWLDTFNRADGALGTPLVGSALTVDTGTYTIVSNRAVSGSAGNNRMLATLSTPDYAYEITNVAAVGQWWIIFRGVDTANYWRVGANAAGSSALVLQNIAAGAVASTYQDGILTNQGDRIRVVCRGRRFRIFVNGRCWYESQDATGRHVTGVKIGAQCNNAGTSFDNMLVIA